MILPFIADAFLDSGSISASESECSGSGSVSDSDSDTYLISETRLLRADRRGAPDIDAQLCVPPFYESMIQEHRFPPSRNSSYQ